MLRIILNSLEYHYYKSDGNLLVFVRHIENLYSLKDTAGNSWHDDALITFKWCVATAEVQNWLVLNILEK